MLGKKGELTAILRGIGALPAEDRPKVGAIANEFADAVEAALGEARPRLGGAELGARLAAEAVDVTTPGRPIRRGSLHPILETAREIADVFAQFGFVVYEGPEVEDDVTNFQMLNIPPDHPARDLWDTLYVDIDGPPAADPHQPGPDPGHAPGTAADPRPPARPLLPLRGRRCEPRHRVLPGRGADDRRGHVDGGPARACWTSSPTRCSGRTARPASGPGYYPFTEPSVAFDILCVICDGEKCPACSRTGWMTILGAGMVHPVVLRYGGIDPERYQGFAFGMGVERIANLRHASATCACTWRTTCASWEQFR